MLTKKNSINYSLLVLVFIIIVKFIIQYLVIHPVYELHRDEFLHLDQANHPAFGYLSIPPLTSWLSGLIKLLGNNVFWIKFFPAVFGALTILVVWKTVEFLNGGIWAKVAAAFCLLFSVLLRINTLYQPNSFDILSWSLVFYFFIRYNNNQNSKWIILAAISFALGFLNKYNIVFLAAGLFPALLLSPQRKIFKQPALYLAILIMLALILPNLIWQYQNGFPVLYHMNELSRTQLVNINSSDFLIAQAMFFTGALPVLAFGLFALISYKPFKKYRFLFLSFFITLFIFIALSAKGYYAIGLYPVYFAFGAVYAENIFKRRKFILFKAILILLPVVYGWLISRIALPNVSPEEIVNNPGRWERTGMLKWEDGKNHHLPQDFADMLGWKELAFKASQAVESISNPHHTIVICDNYGQAGAINFYSKKGIRANSFNADYLYWFDLSVEYKNLVRIVTKEDAEEELATLKQYFETATFYDSIANPLARESGTSILVFTNAFININEVISAEIMIEKSKISGVNE